MLLLPGAHNNHSSHTPCPVLVHLVGLNWYQRARHRLSVVPTVELLVMSMAVAVAWLLAIAQLLKVNSKRYQFMAALLVAAEVATRLVVVKRMATALKKTTMFQMETIAAIPGVVPQISCLADEEASRATVAVSLSSTTVTQPRVLCQTTLTSNHEATPMSRHQPIWMLDAVAGVVAADVGGSVVGAAPGAVHRLLPSRVL